VQELLQRLGVNKTRTMLLHPQTDSMVAWWSATSKWSRSTYERSSHPQGNHSRQYGLDPS
jgi:hypothetical protein